MGIKLSKFFKRTYVVSEAVQTDLSIRPVDENRDPDPLIKSPPREVYHLCDPRSVSKGIIRTPVLCQMHYGKLSPIKDKKKPYLETNLDEVLSYHSPDPCNHLIEIYRLDSSQNNLSDNQPAFENHHLRWRQNKFDADENDCPPNDFMDISQYETRVIENYDFNDIGCDNLQPKSNRKLTVDLDDLKIDTHCCNDMVSSVKTADESENKNLLKPLSIDCSESVQQVCQKILDELLDVDTNKTIESKNEIFVDGNISDIVVSMKNLCIDGSSCLSPTDRTPKRSTHVYDQNIAVSKSSDANSKFYNKFDINNCEEQSWNLMSPKKLVKKRQPLGEVNRNMLPNQPTVGSSKSHQSFDNAPLKMMLPLLPPQNVAPISKPHRSKWDTENTFII